MVSEPSVLASFFATGSGGLRAGAATERVLPMLAGSILCADGEEHARRRRILLPAFNKSYVASHAGLIEEETARALRRLPRGRPVAVLPEFHRLSFHVLARVVLGIENEGTIEELRRRVARYISGPAVLAAWPGPLQPLLARTLAERRAGLDAILRREIASRRAHGDDALSLLIDAGEDDEVLLAELRALLIVGHETAACSLAWGAELLARHATSAERLAEDEAYAEAFVEETLRLRPAVVDAVRPARDPGWDDRHGGSSPRSYRSRRVAEPDRFGPERFLGARPAAGAYIPFGGGARRCLGAQLAMLELRVVLQTVARQLRLSPAHARIERARLHGTALTPDRGAKVVLRDL